MARRNIFKKLRPVRRPPQERPQSTLTLGRSGEDYPHHIPLRFPVETVQAAIRAALRHVGTPPALIHAFLHTLQFVTERNQGRWSDEDMRRWVAAVESYDPGARPERWFLSMDDLRAILAVFAAAECRV